MMKAGRILQQQESLLNVQHLILIHEHMEQLKLQTLLKV
ncbi:hypothetical protein ECDEC7B_0858 [Escherichia coli DEC7B]|nr:hypothetical protein ECDEC7B_0858 [Escherichia coli DEC7B]